MELEKLLQQQAKQEKIKDLTLDKNGICRLLVDGKHSIVLEKSIDKKSFYMYAIVCSLQCNEQQKRSIFTQALSGNLFQKETGTAVLGLDEDTNNIILSEHIEEHSIDFQSYYHKLENFVSTLVYWQQKIEKFLQKVPHHIDDVPLDLLQKENMRIFFV